MIGRAQISEDTRGACSVVRSTAVSSTFMALYQRMFWNTHRYGCERMKEN
jgi:hypothetical protein